VNLQHINIRPQPFNTLFHRIKNMLPTQAHPIRHEPIVLCTRRNHRHSTRIRLIRNSIKALRHDHHAVPRDVVLLQGLANDLLGAAVRVDVRRVPGVDAGLVGVLEEGQGAVFVEDPRLPV
jgi:hypothetical protein